MNTFRIFHCFFFLFSKRKALIFLTRSHLYLVFNSFIFLFLFQTSSRNNHRLKIYECGVAPGTFYQRIWLKNCWRSQMEEDSQICRNRLLTSLSANQAEVNFPFRRSRGVFVFSVKHFVICELVKALHVYQYSSIPYIA